MTTLSLFIAIIALITSLIAIWMAKRAGGGGVMRAPPPVNFTITGNIKIINDCDGQQASIPARVTIETDLSNAAGNVKVPGSATINVGPDPADPNGPVKIGTYTITALWPNAAGQPAHWTRPDVLDQPNGRPVCQTISCPNPRVCRDMATGTRTVPFVNPITNHDIRVNCSCTDP
jgi:hypothetical protein